MNISSLFHTAARTYPERIAIIDPKSLITYRELQTGVEQTATYFRKKGIQQGDRVLVFVPMSVDLYRIVLALFHCGATAVFLDEWVSKKRMELCCEIAQCRGFVGIPKARIFALFSKELRRIPIKLRPKKMIRHSSDIASVSPDASALITFTTGSTGRPKAADRTHGFLKEQFDALLDEIDPAVEDVDMPVLPIVLFMNLGVGCTSVIANFSMSKPETLNVDTIVQQLRQYQVNRITASPFFVTELAKKHATHNTTYHQLHKIFTGGAPVFPSTAALYKKAFPNTKVNIVYGSTEAEPISSIEAHDLAQQAKSLQKGLPVGQVFHKTQLRIVAITDTAIPSASQKELDAMTLPEGSIGEIIVSGPHVLKQYFNNEEAFRANKIVVGDAIWHRTGDSGWIKDGELHLTGRCKQLIYRDNDILSPFIIENQLMELQDVSMGTLLHVNDKLVLALETTLTENAVKSQLPSIPFDEVWLTDIPRDPRHNSKIDYGALVLQYRNN